MEYIKATEKDLEKIVILVQETIKTIYPKPELFMINHSIVAKTA